MAENNQITPLTSIVINELTKCDPIDLIKSVSLTTYDNYENKNINRVDYGGGKIGYSSDVIMVLDGEKIRKLCNNDDSKTYGIKSKLYRYIENILRENISEKTMSMLDGKENIAKFSYVEGNTDYFPKLENFVRNVQEEIERRKAKAIE